MKKATIAILPAALASAFLAGCAGYGGNSASLSQYRIVPVQRMSGLDNPEVWYQRGRYFQGQGRWDQAEQSFRKALELQANHAEAHNALGAVFAARGQLVEAEGAFRTAVQLAPDQAHIRGNLGRALLLQGRNEEALLALKDAALIDPGNVSVRSNLAEARKRVGQEAALAATQDGGVAVAKVLPPETGKGRVSVLAAMPVTVVSPAGPTNAVSAVNPGGGAGLLVLPAIPVGDSRSPIRVLEPQAGGTLAVATLSYGEVSRPAVRELTVREEVKRVEAVALPSVAPSVVPDAPVAQVERKASTPGVPLQASTPVQSSAVAHAPERGGVRLEVANGNGVEGMARRVRTTLRSDGYSPVRITNHKPYTQKETVVQFRSGFESEAKRLGERFPQQAQVIYETRLDARADVRIVLGRDLPRQFAMNDGRGERNGVQLAGVSAASTLGSGFE